MFTLRKSGPWFTTFIFITITAICTAATQTAFARGGADLPSTWYVSPTGNDLHACSTTDEPCGTINGAIGKAAAGNTINVAIGTYYASTGPVAVIDRNITLSGGWNTGFTLQTGRSTIDGMAAYRGVTISDGKIVTIDRFQIQHGSDSSQGGGINDRGNLTLTNSVVSNNASGWMGGGINVYGTLTVSNSTIRDNIAGTSGHSGGGGGGGIEVYSGAATLDNTTISGNQIIGSFSGSAIDTGGPIYLNNVTVSGNTGAYALATFVGHVILNNTTVTGNSGGISNNSGVVSLQNSILAENNIFGNAANCSGSIGTSGFNLIGIKNSGCTFTATTGDKVGTTALPIDPMLGPLQDNGGPTLTRALLLGSPATDAGNSVAEPGSGGSACLLVDQRGLPRPALAEGTCDIGAFELQRPYVTSISRVSSSPTSASSVDFIVSFTDAVSGVDTTDFSLTTSDVTGASITGASGSGNSYMITVNAGSGNGTIRLDLIDDDTIQDTLYGKPLGGLGLVNGDFISGQTYTIAHGPQVTAVTRTDPSPTAAANVHFNVGFSTSVTGVDASDFTLTTTGLIGASITSVSGSADTYTVTVNTGDGAGTVKLDVIDDDTIIDGLSTPLGGSGLGNGNFATGQAYIIQAPPAIPMWYVAPTGSDTNLCSIETAPCLTINATLGKAAAGDQINVAIGTYYASTGSVASISKNITLSGGWNPNFSSQTGMSTIDGMAAYRGVTISDGKIVTIDRFQIQHGSDNSQGGGVNNRGNLTLTNSVVSNNASGWMGGGINVYGTLTINNSTISNNRAGSGGSGGGGGGGIEVYGGSSTATLNNTTLSGNQIIGSYSGSAIDTDGPVYLNNTTVSGNTGAYALETFVGHLILNNTTVIGNSGGISNNSGVVSLRNSILSGNNISGSPANCTGTIGTSGYNLIGVKNSGCTFTATNGDKVGSIALPIDPMLGPLADNGGPTFTHALKGGSPALNAGNPAIPGSGGNACLAIDQRGVTRPVDATCDIGAYEGHITVVNSVNRVNPSPTSASVVSFALTFSEAVTGVDVAAPFNNFALKTTGVAGASITSVSGSGNTYTVTVNTGSGNGTIRLDIIDEDSILDSSSNPLGGPGTGNGNFIAGQLYTVQKIPLALLPTSTTRDTTPTYKWSKTPGATQYRYQLLRGTAVVYTKTVSASVCGTACSNTPTTLLIPGVYKWRVQAQLHGAWTNYSPYKVFILIAPKAGLWKGNGVEFYVTPNRVSVDNFAIYLSVNGCGYYKITNNPLVAINAGKFLFTGKFYANGTFNNYSVNSAGATGLLGLSSFYIPGCGSIKGGPYPWTATWRSVSQPSAVGTQDLNSVLLLEALDPAADLGTAWSVNPEP